MFDRFLAAYSFADYRLCRPFTRARECRQFTAAVYTGFAKPSPTVFHLAGRSVRVHENVLKNRILPSSLNEIIRRTRSPAAIRKYVHAPATVTTGVYVDYRYSYFRSIRRFSLRSFAFQNYSLLYENNVVRDSRGNIIQRPDKRLTKRTRVL